MLPSCEEGSTFLELFIADSTAFQARMSTCLGLDDETPHTIHHRSVSPPISPLPLGYGFEFH